jgi:CO dehydrogenase/acetyl-CoA synthase alpha subunit
MKAVTIPKNLAQKGDLVVIPRKEYDHFSVWKKTVRVQLDEEWFWTPQWQKKEEVADRAIRAKKVSGPFSNHADLLAALNKK